MRKSSTDCSSGAPDIRLARPTLAPTALPADMNTMTGAEATLATQLAKLNACRVMLRCGLSEAVS